MEQLTGFQKFRRSLGRWYKTRFKGYVILITYSEFEIDKDGYTEEPYDCMVTYRLVKKSELPAEAVHCTGEPYHYCLDTVKRRYKMHDRGFGALDANLYMEFNGFEDALSSKWTDFNHFDMKKFLIISGIVLVVAFIMMFYMKTKGA